MTISSSALFAAERPSLSAGHGPFAGKYSVERILGQGGMGTVFEARHLRLGQRVAIKVLGSALLGYPELVERFEREARACGALSSAHAVRVFDIDATEDGTPFIVMELLSGRDLSQILDREGAQSVARSVRWVVEACDAIAEAHRLGIIHRDLKPSNLFLAAAGEGRHIVKVLDFGIAKRVTQTDSAITQSLAPLGTPQYMSPEQVRCARDVDARTDIWSLGVTLYELVTGRTPFPDESSSACIAAIAADPVPDPRTIRPELGDAFVAVLMRALAKSADDRYQSIEELVAALAPFVDLSQFPVLPQGTAGASYEVRTFAPRGPVESHSDRTVPPAVSIASPQVSRRYRSVALASAAAFALAVVGLAAELGANDKTPSAMTVSAPAPAEIVQVGAPAIPAPAAVADPPTAGEEPVEVDVEPAAPRRAPAPLAAPAPHRAPIEAKPPALRPASGVAAATAEAKRAVPPSARGVAGEKATAQLTASRIVHGGLSSPGF